MNTVPTISTYSKNSDIIMYVMRMYGRRNMQAYTDQIFRVLYNKLKDNILGEDFSFYVADLGKVKAIIETKIFNRVEYSLIVDDECRPTRIYTKGKRCWVKPELYERRNNVKVYWKAISDKTQIKIINILFNKWVSRCKWVFNPINTPLHINDLIYSIKKMDHMPYYPELAIWKIWKNGIQDNINNMQSNALINILNTTQSEGIINKRIRTIGMVLNVHDENGQNNFMVSYMTDKNEHIVKSIWGFTPEQRMLIVNQMATSYIRKHKNIFDKFIKNPAVSIRKIVKTSNN